MDDASTILEQLSAQPSLGQDELKQLPRWALVTLAVRCARRAQPLFTSDWPDAPQEFRQAIERALHLAETSAAEGKVQPELKEAAAKAGQAATTAANLTARFASFTVTFAAVNAAHVASAENTDNAVAFVQATMDACHKSATFANARVGAFKKQPAGNIAKALHQALRRDLDDLVRKAKAGEWSDETPVPVNVLGPLWPYPAPAGLNDSDQDGSSCATGNDAAT